MSVEEALQKLQKEAEELKAEIEGKVREVQERRQKLTPLDREFLIWLAGYVDHGGLCKAYHKLKTQKIRGRTYGPYPILSAHFILHFKKEEDAKAIKEFFRGGKVHYRQSGSTSKAHPWQYSSRGISDIFGILLHLTPWLRGRREEAEKLIEEIRHYTLRKAT